jgi:undecaprenol kinase
MKSQNFVKRMGFALAGIAAAARHEASFRIQLLAAAVVVGVLIALRPAALWWALAVLAIAGVLAVEMVNAAVEGLADRLHPERHPEIKRVKDLAAGAVLIASLGAVGVAAAFVAAMVWGG